MKKQNSLIYFKFFFKFDWHIVDLQCCIINNAMNLVSGVQQNKSVINRHISILFQVLSHIGYYRILSSLCHTVGPCWLSIYIQWCVYVNPKLLIYPPPQHVPFGNRKFVFKICVQFDILFFPCIFRATPWRMEVHRLGVKPELQLLTYTTATATPDP